MRKDFVFVVQEGLYQCCVDVIVVVCVKIWQACKSCLLIVQDTSQHEASNLQRDAHNESNETRKQCVWSAIYCSDDSSRNHPTVVKPLQS